MLPGSIKTEGININWDDIFTLPKDYWVDDIKETKKFLETEVGDDMPKALKEQLEKIEQRINKM